MAQPLAFQLNLTGNFAQQVTDASGALVNVNGQLTGVAQAAKQSQSAFAGFTVDIVQGAKTALGAVKTLASGFVSLFEDALKVVSEEQDLNLAMKLNIGDMAPEFQELADRFAKQTRFDDSDIKRAMLPLFKAGITDKTMVDDILTAATDIVAKNPGMDIGDVSKRLSMVGLKGEIDFKALKEIGVSEADYYKNLADLLGTTAEKAKKQTSAGLVDKDTLLSVALDEMQKQGGGAIGGAGMAAGQTLGATLKRLSDLQGNLFKQLDGLPGMVKVQALLDRFVEVLGGEVGTKLIAGFSTVIDRLASLVTPEQLTQWLGTLPTLLGEVVTWVGYMVDGWNMIKPVLMGVWKLFVAYGEFLGKFAAHIYLEFEALFNLPGVLFKLGENMWKSLRDGFVNGVRSIGNSVTEFGDEMVNKLKSTLGIASPSKVFAEMGGYSAEGFAVGLERGMRGIEIGGVRTMGGGGAAGGLIATVNINVTGASSDAAEDIAQAVRRELARMYDEVASAA